MLVTLALVCAERIIVESSLPYVAANGSYRSFAAKTSRRRLGRAVARLPAAGFGLFHIPVWFWCGMYVFTF
jgi:hypothetical protein